MQWRVSWPVVGRIFAAFTAARLLTVLAVETARLVRDPSRQLLDLLVRWDGEWYLNIVEHGYPPLNPYHATDVPGNLAGNGAFFPLYPMLIRLTSQVGGLTPSFAAVLLSFVGGLSATLLCYVLMRHIAGDGAAKRAAMLFAFFPGSFVFSMAYAEGIMLALAMACLLALLDRRWLLAGAMAALATATRPTAMALVLCCAWAAAAHLRRTGEMSALVAPLLAPIGFVGYLTLLWWRTGEPLAWFIIQREGWGDSIGFGRLTVEFLMVRALASGQPGPVVLAAVFVFGLAVVVAGGLLLFRWRPPIIVSLYAAGVLLPLFLAEVVSARPRFVLTAFPLLMAISWRLTGRWHVMLVAASAVLLAGAGLTYIFAGIDIP